jgi:DNA-3-methyladenine glycosylase I
MRERERCPWCVGHADYERYHDEEWGVPSHDERHLFEMLNLEGAQAGLSWLTILRKRDGYRRAFDGWDPERISRYRPAKVQALLRDPGIVRNRLKVNAVVENANALLRMRAAGESLDGFLWSFVDGRPQVGRWRRMGEIPASTPVSDALSKALQKRGFRFVGTTICYAFMQAVGLVDDHLPGCWRYTGKRRRSPTDGRERAGMA